MLYRMRRSCLIPPSSEETNEPFEHLVATVTHESYLCPLPLTVQPIIWNYDHCLRLYLLCLFSWENFSLDHAILLSMLFPKLRTQFGKLGSIIAEHPRLKEGDPGVS